MTSRLAGLLPAGVSAYAVGGLVAVIVAIKLSRSSKLDVIPTVGASGWLGAWWAGMKHVTHFIDQLQEGYEKHNKRPFKVPAMHRWLVILSSPEHVDEVQRAPDNAFSFMEAINEHLQIEYTMSPGIHHNPYHIPILRSHLTRDIGALYPELRDEVITAFEDILDLSGNEWKSVPALKSVQNIVCRATNRIFVGLPLCRHSDWIHMNIEYTIDCMKGAVVATPFPAWLKPLAIRLFTKIPQFKQHGKKLLGPIIEERQRCLKEYGNKWIDKPNDYLSWLMDEATDQELTVDDLTERLLATNIVAIHTTSGSFTNALLYLAGHPECIQPLREEIEAVVEKDGWSKAALGKMRKLDSFIRECQRMDGVVGATMLRMAVKDVTLLDGTCVPKGAVVLSPARSIHHDETFYPNAHVFDPFRFSNMRGESGEGTKHHLVSTTSQYLAFGHGRHACPGRFFAASEMMTMLAHVVVAYDIKLVDGAAQPKPLNFALNRVPDPKAMVMFRRRVE